MSKPAWYRSLYWRIAIGFVLFLAAMLALQGGALVYLIAGMEVAPGPPPPEVTRLIARELSEALTANPKLDIQQFFRQEYEGRVPLVAIMKDGRVVTTHGPRPSDGFVQDIRARLNADPDSFVRGRGGRGRAVGPRPMRPEGGALPEARTAADAPHGSGGRRHRRRRPGGRCDCVAAFRIASARPHARGGRRCARRPRYHRRRAADFRPGSSAAAKPRGRCAQSRRAAISQRRAREDGGDEVAALAQAFNQMTHDLQQRAAQLQAADRTRRLLLADVSHELMTPLTGMRGYLETLSLHAQSLDPETRERYLAIIRDETQRVEHIVGDLLDLSRLEGGGESFDAQDVPLEDLFGRVVARHGRAAEEKGVEMATNIAPGAEIVTGDPMRLEQALQNLAANALRHTPKGGRVALNAAFEDGAIVVTVSDTGSGIPPEHLPHVFDRFYKVDPSRAGQASGSGLGLSIVKAIVERHGGDVTAASQPGGGTTFTLKFPPERPINE